SGHDGSRCGEALQRTVGVAVVVLEVLVVDVADHEQAIEIIDELADRTTVHGVGRQCTFGGRPEAFGLRADLFGLLRARAAVGLAKEDRERWHRFVGCTHLPRCEAFEKRQTERDAAGALDHEASSHRLHGSSSVARFKKVREVTRLTMSSFTGKAPSIESVASRSASGSSCSTVGRPWANSIQCCR